MQSNAMAVRLDAQDLQLKQDTENHVEMLAMRDAEIQQLKDAFDKQMKKQHDLIDVNTRIRLEMSAFRHMLDLEDDRLENYF